MDTSTDNHDALFKEAIELLDQRQTNTRANDPELDTRFFNALLLCLLESTTDHWWCSPRILPLAAESLWLFSLADLPYILKYKGKLNGILQNCQQCVKCYYKAKHDIRTRYLIDYTPEKVNRLFNIMEDFDQSRLQASTTLSIDQQCCATIELVSCPYYRSLHDELFCTLFDTIETAEQYPTLEYSEVQNITLLAFHSQRSPRVWACQLLEKFADENPTCNNLNQESIDGLVAIARMTLCYFGSKHCPGDKFELHFPKYNNNNSSDNNEPSFTLMTTQNSTNIWKGLRRVLKLLPDTALDNLITSIDPSSSAPIFDLLTYQLQCTPPDINITGLLKTMTLLWKRLQDRFWGKHILLHMDITTYYTLLRRICDHHAYRAWTAFAQEDTDDIRTIDGATDSGKKLIRGTQEMVDWIFPFWCSLCKIDGVDYLTDKVLDTLLSYFQLPIWTLLFRACAAIVAFRVIQHSITENTDIPVERINRFAHVWMPFAMDSISEGEDSDHDGSTPVSILQHARESATTTLTYLLCQDSRSLRDAYITLARNSSTSGGSQIISDQQTLVTSVYPKVWDLLQAQTSTGTANILSTLLSVCAPLVSIVTIQQQAQTKNKPLDPGQSLLLDRMIALCDMVSVRLKIQHDAPWKVRKAVMRGPSMAEPLVSMLAYSTTTIREMTCTLTTKHKQRISKSPTLTSSNLVDAPLRMLFARQPQQTMAAMIHVLTDFMELSNMHAETHIVATTLGQVLASATCILLDNESGYLSELVKADETDKEQQTIMEYWNALWQVIGTVFIDSYQWSKTHESGDILDMVTLWMNIAAETIGCCHLLQKLVSDDLLSMDSLVSAVDGLSSWVDVSQRSLLVKLMPLLEKLLRQLQLSDIKISLDAYDRLMSAMTGLDTTLLEPNEKDLLLSALHAHEPAKVIFLDDSDDEYMEWHTLPLAVNSTSTTMTVSSGSDATSHVRQTKTETTTSQQSATNNTHSKTSETNSKITGHIDLTNASVSSVDGITSKTTAMVIDADTFFDDWDDSEPPAIQKEAPPKPVLPSKSPSYPGNKRKNTTSTTAPSLSTSIPTTVPERYVVSKNAQLSNLALKENPVHSVESSDDDNDGYTGLLGLVDNSNKKRKLDQQKQSLEKQQQQQQQKTESTNLHLIFDTQQTRHPAKSMNPVNSTQQLLQQRRARIRQAEHERKMKKDPNIDQLYKTVLSWSLENIKSDSPPPHISSIHAFCHVQDTYGGYQEYYDVFEPLLLLEIWSQFIRAKDTLTASNVMDGFTMASRCHINDFVDVTFNVPLSIKVNLAVDDLVCMSSHFGPDFFFTRMIRGAAVAASESLKGHQWHEKAFLGKVMTVAKGKNTGDIVVRCYFPPERIIILNSLAPKSTWRCVKVTSMMMVQREYAALLGLRYYELANDLLHPHPAPMPILCSQDVQNCAVKYGVNKTQATAIVGALNKPKGFTLIQGPPGTGKTKTILALINQLLEEQKQQATKKRGGGKILVCAPSNAAVDEIAKRLKDGIRTTEDLVKPKVVRIGALDSVNTSVRDLLLDRQVDQIVNPSPSPLRSDNDNDNNNNNNSNNNNNNNSSSSSSSSSSSNTTMECDDNDHGDNNRAKFSAKRDKIRETIRTLRLEIEQVDRDACNEANSQDTTFELRNRRKDLRKQLELQWTMIKDVAREQQEFIKDLNMCRHRARESILQNCDIVCTTLNGSGHQVLFEMNMVFDTVIVDEAAQAVEVSTLIPLKYDCKRCVLVGDPNQLPPTVLSQFASKFDYEQSLFVRMEKNAPDNVYLLSIQYRMHPLISAFPSKLFYQSKLLDGPQMAEKSAAVWHRDRLFPPFKFFDIINGKEQQGRGSSLYNSLEADAAVALVDKLATNYPNLKLAYKIGIIAPYKDQVSHLKLRFEQHFGNKISDVIDFNTVDGFQGQEKDIIIFSCVRASSEYGNSIGFLSDVRRMNVGLTRAKKSLFVLGNADTLLVNRFWKTLVIDAENRGLLCVCQPPFFRHQLIPGRYPKNVFDAEPGVMQNEVPSQPQQDDYEALAVTKSSTTVNVTATEATKRLALTPSVWQHQSYIPNTPNGPSSTKTTNTYNRKTN